VLKVHLPAFNHMLNNNSCFAVEKINDLAV